MTGPANTKGPVTVAAIQALLPGPRAANLAEIERRVREAAGQGAQIILPPELFDGPYFCRTQDEAWFDTAAPTSEHPTVAAVQALAAELGVVIPTSFFERSGLEFYNSLAVIDADGAVVGVYRKSHIPDGPGYQEKFYFRPGDTGFRAFDTRFGRIGAAICWDQWFPEAARALALAGADLIVYPTAIGSEPEAPDIDTRDPWRRVMQGHAAANHIPIVAANRIGVEHGQAFYGSSFITDPWGAAIAECGADAPGIAVATLDLEAITQTRARWGFFRDRRPDLYPTG